MADLEKALYQEILTDGRTAAETAYALAWRYRTEHVDCVQSPSETARKWALRSIELLDTLPSETVAQVSSTRISVGGVELPALLHADVVRARLADLLRV